MKTSFILGLIALVALAGAGLYFFSDVFSTKIDQAVEQVARWTPENIANDPKGYLTFCQKQTTQIIKDLKASELATSQNRGKNLSMKEEATRKIEVGKKALADLKVAYRAANENGEWPISWKGQPRDEDWTKRQIVGLHTQVKQQESLVAKCDEGVRRCDAELAKIKDLTAKAHAQLREIEVATQRVKVEELSTDLKDRLVSMRSVLTTLVDSAENVGGDISLEGLADEAETTVDEQEFQAIMSDE